MQQGPVKLDLWLSWRNQYSLANWIHPGLEPQVAIRLALSLFWHKIGRTGVGCDFFYQTKTLIITTTKSEGLWPINLRVKRQSIGYAGKLGNRGPAQPFNGIKKRPAILLFIYMPGACSMCRPAAQTSRTNIIIASTRNPSIQNRNLQRGATQGANFVILRQRDAPSAPFFLFVAELRPQWLLLRPLQLLGIQKATI